MVSCSHASNSKKVMPGSLSLWSVHSGRVTRNQTLRFFEQICETAIVEIRRLERHAYVPSSFGDVEGVDKVVELVVRGDTIVDVDQQQVLLRRLHTHIGQLNPRLPTRKRITHLLRDAGAWWLARSAQTRNRWLHTRTADASSVLRGPSSAPATRIHEFCPRQTTNSKLPRAFTWMGNFQPVPNVSRRSISIPPKHRWLIPEFRRRLRARSPPQEERRLLHLRRERRGKWDPRRPFASRGSRAPAERREAQSTS